MSRLRAAVIVEGDGEVAAVPVLLRRLWAALGGEFIEVLQPIRRKRAEFERQELLTKAVRLAANKLNLSAANTDPALIMILFDRDPSKELPCQLGPRVLEWARADAGGVDVSCVVANLEYETWFAASAESLGKYVRLRADECAPVDPEQQRCGKKWVEDRFIGVKYSPTQDQPAMSASVDVGLARQRSASFAKLCRELERRLHRTHGSSDFPNRYDDAGSA